MQQPGMAVLKTTTSRAEAEVIRGVLQSEGIDPVVDADDAGQTNPEFDLTRFIRVLVPEGELTRAQGILAAAEERGEAMPSRPEIEEG